jgi:hypothetical protein
MMDTSSDSAMRRTIRPAPPALLRYAVGDALTTATASRASAGAYTATLADTLVRYEVGASLASATGSRASSATFTGNG